MALRDDLQTTLGATYTIEHELAAGGMSRVFVATDTTLGRRVVVKTLSPDFAAAVSAERFRREIRLAASLQQANIVPLLSAGESNALPYYTMPFVEGESLRDHLRRHGALSLREAVSVVRDTARALAFAHERGVVHRDIKPENILLSGSTAVVTDFGIAKAIEASRTDGGLTTLTQVGIALGTPAYMAPEQVSGDVVDQRADIYSLGVVAYELLAGAPPFTGKTAQALFAAHIAEKPLDLAQRRSDTPGALAALVMKCLEKDPAHRPQSARDVLGALESVAITGDVAALSAVPSRQSTIAVMPFANMSADPDAEYFSDGMSEEILNALVRIPGLRVIARTSSFALKGTDARQVGERLDAGVVVEGSVRRAGDRIRVSAQLIDSTSGIQLWSERYDREMKDVFAVQDEITAAVRDALSEKLAGIGALPRAKPVIDAETYEMFLRARHLIQKAPDGLVKGAELMQQVLDRAPTYAPALTEMAHGLTLLSNFGVLEPIDAKPRADALARQAIEQDPADPIPHAVLGHNALYYHFDWAASLRHFDRAIALGPSHATALSWTSFYFSSIGRHEEATAMSRRAVLLDPLNLLTALIDVFVHHFARRWADVIALSERMAEVDPNFSEGYRIRSYSLLKLGRIEEAHTAAETAVRLSGGHPYHVLHVAITHLSAGRRAAAEAILAQFESAPTSQSIYDILVCNLNGPLGNHDRAFAAMERYYDRRGHWMAMLQCDALYDVLRADPRFLDMVRRVGIPPWEGPPPPMPPPTAGGFASLP